MFWVSENIASTGIEQDEDLGVGEECPLHLVFPFAICFVFVCF